MADLSAYHTSEQLVAEFGELQRRCDLLEVTSAANDEVELLKIRIRDRRKQPRHRVLLFFGEHSRELISSETALVFAQTLCGGDPLQAERVSALLSRAEFVLFPNINEAGRRRVERGEYCVRENEHRVDLNRNWSDHWEDDSQKPSVIRRQSFGGNQPFSEPETRVLKREAERFRPTVFITVHSGTLGMYIPYAWSGKEVADSADRAALHRVIDAVNDKYCGCQAGPAGKEVGYMCPGTCLDWMYDVAQTTFSYGFEIWDMDHGYTQLPRGRPAAARAQTLLLTLREAAAAMATRARRRGLGTLRDGSHASAPTIGAFPAPADDDVRSCLEQFNPTAREDFAETTAHWTRVFFDVILSSMDEFDRMPARV